MTNDFPGEVPRCSCPNGQAGILTSGKCACAPLPAGPAAHVPLSKKNEEIDDTAAKDTEDLDRQSDLEERAVNCAFKITCPYMQHAVRQNGVCTCVPQRTKEKRDTAESTLPDEQPRRPAAPCAFEINCPYMQHAVRQNGACTCIPVRSKEKRSIVESSLHEKSYRHQAPNPCAATRCPKHFFATQFDNKCTCAPLTFKDKRRSAALDDLDHKDQASG